METTTDDLLARRDKLLGPAYRLFYDRPVHLVRGEGVWLYDKTGRKYLDMYNNVPHVGHCHPRIVDAICEQPRKLKIDGSRSQGRPACVQGKKADRP